MKTLALLALAGLCVAMAGAPGPTKPRPLADRTWTTIHLTAADIQDDGTEYQQDLRRWQAENGIRG